MSRYNFIRNHFHSDADGVFVDTETIALDRPYSMEDQYPVGRKDIRIAGSYAAPSEAFSSVARLYAEVMAATAFAMMPRRVELPRQFSDLRHEMVLDMLRANTREPVEVLQRDDDLLVVSCWTSKEIDEQKRECEARAA